MEPETRFQVDPALSEQGQRLVETARHLGRDEPPPAVETAAKTVARHKPVEDKDAKPKQREAEAARG